MPNPQHVEEKVTVELSRERAEHLFGRCTESTNAPKINGYSCEECREVGEAIRAALNSEQPSLREAILGEREELLAAFMALRPGDKAQVVLPGDKLEEVEIVALPVEPSAEAEWVGEPRNRVTLTFSMYARAVSLSNTGEER